MSIVLTVGPASDRGYEQSDLSAGFGSWSPGGCDCARSMGRGGRCGAGPGRGYSPHTPGYTGGDLLCQGMNKKYY